MAKEKKHTIRFYQAVDAVVLTLLENSRYLKRERSKELTSIVKEQLQCTARTAQRYIHEARKEILKIGNEKREIAFIKEIRDREYLLAKTKVGEYKDYKLALEIMKDRAKLFGLYVEKVEHSGKIALERIDFNNLSKEQLRKIAQAKSEEELIQILNEFNITTN